MICACGKAIEYISAQVQAAVEDAIERDGPDQRIYDRGHVYLVPRHHMACHSVRPGELAKAGFPRVETAVGV